MSIEIIKNGIRYLPLKEAKNYSDELVFWNRISDLIEVDEIDFLATGKISTYNKLKRWTGMFLLTNKNIFLIPENKKIEIIKIKISIIEKLVIKKGLLNKININEYGFNFQKKEDERLAISRIDQITDVRINRNSFIPLWICLCYFISMIFYEDKKFISILILFSLPIYLAIETYLNEAGRGRNIFFRVIKGIIYGTILFIIGLVFLIAKEG